MMNKFIASVAAGALTLTMASTAGAQKSYRGNIYKDFTDKQAVSAMPNGDKIVRSYRGNKNSKNSGTLEIKQGTSTVMGTYYVKDNMLCEVVFGETNCYKISSKDSKDPRASTLELKNSEGKTVRTVTIPRS